MIKQEELEKGCMAKAHPEEMTFVLLARDRIAPVVIRIWCFLRIIYGKNGATDPQIQEALACANIMDDQRDESWLQRWKARSR